MRPLKSLALLASALFLFQSHALAQLDPSYRLLPNDQLKISVFGEEDLTGDYALTSRGTVTLPFIGGVKLGGKTPTEAQALIAKAYVDNRILRNPQVNVTVAKFAELSVMVLGKVNKPGPVPIPPGQTRIDLMSAIAGAGDFTGIAKKKKISIKRKKNGKLEEVNAEKLLGEAKQVFLFPGDIVSVPQRLF